MTNEQANQILDRAKEGQQFSFFVIHRALCLTGDIDPDRSNGMDEALQEKDNGAWESRSVQLVANYIRRHYQETGPESGRGFTSTHECFERTK